MKNKIFIAFDYGKINIGIAIGQKITETAYPLTTLKTKKGKINQIELKKIFIEWNPTLAVVGLPLNMDGTIQPITKKVYKFVDYLKKYFRIPIFLEDERLTTKESKEILLTKKIKKDINSYSAAIILESWFRKNKKQVFKNKIKNIETNLIK